MFNRLAIQSIIAAQLSIMETSGTPDDMHAKNCCSTVGAFLLVECGIKAFYFLVVKAADHQLARTAYFSVLVYFSLLPS